MRTTVVGLAGALLLTMTSLAAARQLPVTMTVAQDVVAPGAPVTVTVVGPPLQSFAVLGSSVGAGLSYAGQNLALGTDFAVLASGTLDGTGRGVVTVTPPFLFTALDRYYLQAAASPSPAFLPFELSSGRVLRNADLVGSLIGPAGSAGATGAAGAMGATGATGPAGPPGPTGATGLTGATGTTGARGATGLQGPIGPQGPVGPAGTQILFGTDTSLAAAAFGTDCTIGQIILSAGVRGVGLPADGRLILITSNTALFSLIGTTYGGNGVTNYALPDLRAAAPNGLTYTICDVGVFPSSR